MSHKHTNMEEAGVNYRLVHLELRGPFGVVLAQDASLQAAKSLAGLADRALISLSRLPSLLITLPRYLNSSTIFGWVPSNEMVGQWESAAGAG